MNRIAFPVKHSEAPAEEPRRHLGVVFTTAPEAFDSHYLRPHGVLILDGMRVATHG